eukprot:TRINITY_DN13563_c0_g1_i1.p1 TRINITY_DN13563_c0_g1~~TRINITY_DN13563_c0_g1_i1.p1  ORF type:complete len:372 (-),score=80.55 TRINITY_DN13563_c0_g1_i1:38-1153(-)
MSKGNVTVLGVGRLGICMALSCERKGYNVLGVDVVPSYVEKLNSKTFESPEPLVTQYLKESTNFRATMSLDEGLAHSDKIFLLLATPTGVGEKSYDHTALSSLLTQINDRKVQDKHIIIGCTVLPGYIANVARFLLRDCVNVTLSYNPEFIAQGDVMRGLVNPDMILIGEGNEEIGAWLEDLYVGVCDNKPAVHRMSPESAEITKLSINCFITTKIAFANMVGDAAERTPNASATAILKAVGADSRIGHKYLSPGYGFGGPCFPRDNRALGNYIKSIGIEPLIPLSTDESNKQHARFMADTLLEQNLDVYKFSDVCYKSNCPVPIIEESQKLEVAKIIAHKGKKVIISDRKDVIRNVQIEFGKLFEYEIVN